MYIFLRYVSGTLRDDLENILVTEEIRRQGDEVEFTVTMSDNEYLHARCLLSEFEHEYLHPMRYIMERLFEIRIPQRNDYLHGLNAQDDRGMLDFIYLLLILIVVIAYYLCAYLWRVLFE